MTYVPHLTDVQQSDVILFIFITSTKRAASIPYILFLPPRVGPGSSPQWLTLCGFGHSDGEGEKLPRLSYV